MTTCCISCRVDGCRNTAYCLDDHPASYPCSHGEDLCGDHLGDCADCRKRMDAEIDDALAATLAGPDPFRRGVEDVDPFGTTITLGQREAFYDAGHWAAVKKQKEQGA